MKSRPARVAALALALVLVPNGPTWWFYALPERWCGLTTPAEDQWRCETPPLGIRGHPETGWR